MTANLAKSRDLSRNSGHSPELQYETLIKIVILVVDQNDNENDAVTANIHLVIPVIDQNYNINDVVTAHLTKSWELSHNSGHTPELQYKTLMYILIPVIWPKLRVL